MPRAWMALIPALTLGVAGLAGVAHGTDGAPASPPARPAGPLDLSIRARALGLTDTVPLTPPSIEFEAERAPTGAGTSRWPSARTDLGRGVYLEMGPVCIPGVDEPPFFPSRVRSPRR